MYETFYRFKEKPFALTPDPQFLFLARHHRAALLQLEYGIVNQAVFSLITGEVGSGKTTLIRYLLGRVEKTVVVGLISNTSRSFSNLMQWLCLAYGLEHTARDEVSLYKTFEDFLIREYGRGHQVVLIVDEAQNLGPARLEELRVLSNLNADKHLLLQTILVGQPELRRLIRSPQLVQFAQRIGVDYHIGALSAEETRHYIWHRLRVAGGKASLIAPESIRLVHRYSYGLPRLINQLCDTALVYGYADRKEKIDHALMQQVISDRRANGVFPAAGPRERVVPANTAR